nr:hypothetical protein [Lachnospiraceae bacterium]
RLIVIPQNENVIASINDAVYSYEQDEASGSGSFESRSYLYEYLSGFSPAIAYGGIGQWYASADLRDAEDLQSIGNDEDGLTSSTGFPELECGGTYVLIPVYKTVTLIPDNLAMDRFNSILGDVQGYYGNCEIDFIRDVEEVISFINNNLTQNKELPSGYEVVDESGNIMLLTGWKAAASSGSGSSETLTTVPSEGINVMLQPVWTRLNQDDWEGYVVTLSYGNSTEAQKQAINGAWDNWLAKCPEMHELKPDDQYFVVPDHYLKSESGIRFTMNSNKNEYYILTAICEGDNGPDIMHSWKTAGSDGVVANSLYLQDTDGKFAEDDTAYQVTGNITIEPVWSPIEYTVSFYGTGEPDRTLWNRDYHNNYPENSSYGTLGFDESAEDGSDVFIAYIYDVTASDTLSVSLPETVTWIAGVPDEVLPHRNVKWYDAPSGSSGRQQVTSVTLGTDHDISLYAEYSDILVQLQLGEGHQDAYEGILYYISEEMSDFYSKVGGNGSDVISCIANLSDGGGRPYLPCGDDYSGDGAYLLDSWSVVNASGNKGTQKYEQLPESITVPGTVTLAANWVQNVTLYATKAQVITDLGYNEQSKTLICQAIKDKLDDLSTTLISKNSAYLSASDIAADSDDVDNPNLTFTYPDDASAVLLPTGMTCDVTYDSGVVKRFKLSYWTLGTDTTHITQLNKSAVTRSEVELTAHWTEGHKMTVMLPKAIPASLATFSTTATADFVKNTEASSTETSDIYECWSFDENKTYTLPTLTYYYDLFATTYEPEGNPVPLFAAKDGWTILSSGGVVASADSGFKLSEYVNACEDAESASLKMIPGKVFLGDDKPVTIEYAPFGFEDDNPVYYILLYGRTGGEYKLSYDLTKAQDVYSYAILEKNSDGSQIHTEDITAVISEKISAYTQENSRTLYTILGELSMYASNWYSSAYPLLFEVSQYYGQEPVLNNAALQYEFKTNEAHGNYKVQTKFSSYSILQSCTVQNVSSFDQAPVTGSAIFAPIKEFGDLLPVNGRFKVMVKYKTSENGSIQEADVGTAVYTNGVCTDYNVSANVPFNSSVNLNSDFRHFDISAEPDQETGDCPKIFDIYLKLSPMSWFPPNP